MTSLTNWGLYPVVETDFRSYGDDDALRHLLSTGSGPMIARGLGRSYGDSSLGPRILSSHRHNKMLAFDELTGTVTVEGGVSLREIIDVVLPRGWFPAVTPGTKFVTIGGAIAADVHGKNHHIAGAFGDQVVSMEVMTADGHVAHCSPTENVELFETTCGGMGLTGVILRATIRLQRVATAYIREEILPADNLHQVMALFEESQSWRYSVAWIDCLARGARLGRSILMRGEHATVSELEAAARGQPLAYRPVQKFALPFVPPGFLLNPLTVRTFNSLYHRSQRQHAGSRITNYDTFFYPLDTIKDWNLMYGRGGFTQYQMVFPNETSASGLQALLEAISSTGQGSFLAVLKQFGPTERFISFPRPGYTLALDFPLKARTRALFEILDRIVDKFGGRLYLAKDVRMPASMFDSGYANAGKFRERIRRWDPKGVFGSYQSKRLGITL